MTDVVCTPVNLAGTERERVDDRLAYRYPDAYRRLGATLLRHSSPKSAVRRWLLTRSARVSFGSFNRHDLRFLRAFYGPECEFVTDASYTELGVDRTGRGPEGAHKMMSQLYEGFAEMRWESPVVFDGGERMVVVMTQVVKGHGSGIEVTEAAGSAYRLDGRGRIVSQSIHRDWEAALDAAGFPASLAAEAQASSVSVGSSAAG